MDRQATEFKARLDALAQEIEAKRRDWAQRGVFSDVHKDFLAKFDARRAQAGAKVDAALKANAPWSAFQAELERDYGGMWEEWSRELERMDAKAMRGG